MTGMKGEDSNYNHHHKLFQWPWRKQHMIKDYFTSDGSMDGQDLDDRRNIRANDQSNSNMGSESMRKQSVISFSGLSRRNTTVIPRISTSSLRGKPSLESIQEAPADNGSNIISSSTPQQQSHGKQSKLSPKQSIKRLFKPASPALSNKSLHVDKMTEKALNEIPSDILDVGSCQQIVRPDSPQSYMSYHSSDSDNDATFGAGGGDCNNSRDSLYDSAYPSRQASPNGLFDVEPQSTSLFKLFEEKLTSIRQSEENMLLLRQSMTGVAGKSPSQHQAQLRRSQTGYIVSYGGSGKQEKINQRSSFRKLMLQRPSTISLARLSSPISPRQSVSGSSFTRQSPVNNNSNQFNDTNDSPAKVSRMPTVLKKRRGIGAAAGQLRPISTDSGFVSLRNKQSNDSVSTVIKNVSSADPILRPDTPIPPEENVDSGGDSKLAVPRTSPLSPNRRNVTSILDQIKQSDVPLVEEMSADLKRLIIAADIQILSNLLVNPEVDDHYENFTSDFMLTYRYFMSEKELFYLLKDKFIHWLGVTTGEDNKTPQVSQQLQQQQLSGINASEARIGRLWILDDKEPFPVLLRIVSLLHQWLDEYSYLDYFADWSFTADASDLKQERLCDFALLNEVSSFVEQSIYKSKLKQIRMWSGSFRLALKKKFDAFGFKQNLVMDRRSLTVPIKGVGGIKSTRPRKGTNPEKTHASLLSLSEMELFKQLTLMEMEYFLKIKPLDLYYKQRGQLCKAKNLQSLIERFNHVSYWIATEICMCRSAKTRAEVIKRFIRIANLCYKWHNYNTCLQIVAALSMTCVRRLKKTWKLLPRKYEQHWRELSRIFSAACNYSTYRQDILTKLYQQHSLVLNAANGDDKDDQSGRAAHAKMKEPIVGGIPFMGLHLSDLVFIEEAHGKDIIPDPFNSDVTLVNFTKMRLVAQTFRQFVYLQKVTKYDMFSVDHFTQRFLQHDAFALDEDKLWKASKIIEPAVDFYDEPVHVMTLLSVSTSGNSQISSNQTNE
ncbi:hypothetical protein MP228_008820 [Amoeboaphelidium protococcarum]|nr:hypothetical protein MP228_008820 [Amoeboaphelidium protococcarum]